MELIVDPMDSEDHEDPDGDPEADHDVRHLIEEGEGSDMFDTDSSAGGEVLDHMQGIAGDEAVAAAHAKGLSNLSGDAVNGAE